MKIRTILIAIIVISACGIGYFYYGKYKEEKNKIEYDKAYAGYKKNYEQASAYLSSARGTGTFKDWKKIIKECEDYFTWYETQYYIKTPVKRIPRQELYE